LHDRSGPATLVRVLSQMRRRSCSAKWLAVLALGWAACGAEGHPILVENVDLADGDYYGLAWGGTQVERFYAVARRGAPNGEVVVISPEHEEPCSLGDQVAAYQVVTPRLASKYVVGAPSPARIELQSPEDPANPGKRTLSLADVNCERSDFEITDVASRSGLSRLFQPDLMSFKYLVRTTDQVLQLVDPWTGDKEEVAENVTYMWNRDTSAWLAESGQWVKRDHNGREKARYGENVDALTLLGENDVVYTTKETRNMFIVRAGKEKKLSDDACGATPVDGFIPGALAFMSPCGESRLTIVTADGKERSYEAGVNRSLLATQGRLVFRIDRDDATELWMIESSKPELAAKVQTMPHWMSDSPYVWTGRDGTTFVAAQVSEAMFTIWTVDFSSKDKLLKQVADTGDILAFDVSDQGIAKLLTNGRIELTDRSLQRTIFSIDGQNSSGFFMAFAGLEPALAYRSNVDPDTNLGTLALKFVSGEHFVISDDVRYPFVEVYWPERGLLYATGGDNPRLRFARVEIPCQNTSSAPWACNF
jgi:hypothetical protein